MSEQAIVPGTTMESLKNDLRMWPRSAWSGLRTQTKRTIGELERDIWEIVGDAPASGLTRVPGGEAGRDFIGAVGEGPRNSFGYRRIFNDFKEDDLVSKSLVKDTFGDVAEYPRSKILDPFNINYSEVQFSQDSIGLINWKIKQSN